MERAHELSGRTKAAIVLLSLGDAAAGVLKHLSEDEIEQLTFEMASQRQVRPEVRDAVLQEFFELAGALDEATQGGIEQARDILARAFGRERAEDIIGRLTASLQVRPFDIARKTDAFQLVQFIQNEHPQTIALILAYLNPDKAALILQALPPDKQVEVTRRLASLEHTSPEVIEEIDATLERRLSAVAGQDWQNPGGIEAAVRVLNQVDRGTEKTIMESLEESDPELAEEIKRRMFVFEDIVRLDRRAIELVLRHVNRDDLALALKAATDAVKQLVFRHMTRRAAEMLREEIDLMGPVRLRDIEQAQQRIVATIRKLEEAGEIVIARAGEDEIVA